MTIINSIIILSYSDVVVFIDKLPSSYWTCKTAGNHFFVNMFSLFLIVQLVIYIHLQEKLAKTLLLLYVGHCGNYWNNWSSHSSYQIIQHYLLLYSLWVQYTVTRYSLLYSSYIVILVLLYSSYIVNGFPQQICYPKSQNFMYYSLYCYL